MYIDKIQSLQYTYSIKVKEVPIMIQTICPCCSHRFRVAVHFPAWDKPFEDTTASCPNCGAELLVSDSHEYNEDGTIK